ncbi:hypothetical protein WA026_020497 [Henosepilachna vigintioctopunctata]|uniref:Uncharacterized protein n=1 Tax=Henosepilachna vigintioctopunctata TaxID=420089 RepID=A0AAW1VG25_9CUCU
MDARRFTEESMKIAIISKIFRKVDENGNALHQNTTSKNKKKKVQSDKNVVSCVAAEKVEGHRSDIINDVTKLLEYIGENKRQSGTTKTNAHRSSKQLHKHTSEEGPRNSKKQRAQSSKGKENRSELKKSNSLGEISTVKLENFAFSGKDSEKTDVKEPPAKHVDVTHKVKKETSVDKPRDRRSCGNVEHPTMQNFYKNTNTECIETSSSSDFRVVTKKKKTKKRRNSVSGSRRKMSTAASNGANSSKSDGDRASSPTVVRRKSTCSVPPSDRSNDSSDVDSVHSLPIDTSQRLESSLNADDGPISYAAIAKNSDRKTSHETYKTSSPDSKSINSKENSPVSITSVDPTSPDTARSKITSQYVSDMPVAELVQSRVQNTPTKVPPPDVHNIKSFPSIHASSNKLDRLPKAESKISSARGCTNKLHVGQQNMVQYNNAANITRNSRILSSNASNEELEQQDDIQNNLSIIQASEMEAIQHNSQIMPTMQIPDVQTIEKMHFMNQPGGRMPPHLQQHVLPTQHVQIAPQPQPIHPTPVIPITDIFTDGRPPSTYTAVISHTPHQPGGLAYVKTVQAYEGMRMAQLDQPSYHTAQKGTAKEGVNTHIVPNTVDNQNVLNNNIVTQTTNVEAKRKDSISGKIIQDDNANSASTKQSKFSKKPHFPNEVSSGSSGTRDCSVSMTSSVAKSVHISSVSDMITNSNTSSTSLSGEGLYQQSTSQAGAESSTRDVSATICDNRTNTSDSEDSPRPPVVILSGLNSSKEVTTGLVFGFDVNEQLLSEDICENFVERYVSPVSYTDTSHNHDKIVNYIGLAWDDVRRSHSIGKAQYYSDSP